MAQMSNAQAASFANTMAAPNFGPLAPFAATVVSSSSPSAASTLGIQVLIFSAKLAWRSDDAWQSSRFQSIRSVRSECRSRSISERYDRLVAGCFWNGRFRISLYRISSSYGTFFR